MRNEEMNLSLLLEVVVEWWLCSGGCVVVVVVQWWLCSGGCVVVVVQWWLCSSGGCVVVVVQWWLCSGGYEVVVVQWIAELDGEECTQKNYREKYSLSIAAFMVINKHRLGTKAFMVSHQSTLQLKRKKILVLKMNCCVIGRDLKYFFGQGKQPNEGEMGCQKMSHQL